MKSNVRDWWAAVSWSDLIRAEHHDAQGQDTDFADTTVVEFGGAERGGKPEDELMDFVTCDVCGQSYDRRELAHVMHHRRSDHRPMLRD